MNKSPDAFRTISEVADWLDIQAHVLRFWESKFNQVKPVKRAGGRRYYRPSDMQLLGGIKRLLHEDGLTIKGVQKILREQGVAHVAALSAPLEDSAAAPSSSPAEEPPAEEPVAAEWPDVSAEPRAETASPVTPEAAPEPPKVAQPDPAGDVATAAADAVPAEPQTSAQEELPLPTFLHRRAARPAGDGARTEATVPDHPPAKPERPTPTVIDAPDPPDESEIPYDPGVMASLSRLKQLDDRQARTIGPLVEALVKSLNKLSGAA
jgi:DNA-binding transcriptional MerR regulator